MASAVSVAPVATPSPPRPPPPLPQLPSLTALPLLRLPSSPPPPSPSPPPPPPPPVPPPLPPPTASSPSRDAILLLAVVSRCLSAEACRCPPASPSSPKGLHPLTALHTMSPRPMHPLLSSARHTLFHAPNLVFPSDLSSTLLPSSSSSSAATTVAPLRHSEPPLPLAPPVTPRTKPTSLSLPQGPASTSPSTSPSHPPAPHADISHQLHDAHTLPVPASALYNALANPHKHPVPSSSSSKPNPSAIRLSTHTQTNPQSQPQSQPQFLFHPQPQQKPQTSTAPPLRRALTFSTFDVPAVSAPPRAHSTPPPPRTHNLGLSPSSSSTSSSPAPPRDPAASKRDPPEPRPAPFPVTPSDPHIAPSDPHIAPSDPHVAPSDPHVALRHALSASVHAFAITSTHGIRQYVYCRPLSHLHALVLVSLSVHTPVYISALETAAAHYISLLHPPNPELQCSPKLSADLCPLLFASVGGLPTPLPTRCLSPVSSKHDFPPLHNDDLPVHSVITSPLPSLLDPDDHPSSPPTPLLNRCPDRERDRDRADLPTSPLLAPLQPQASSSGSLPWVLAAEQPDASEASVLRVLELADSTLLLNHFPVRTIICVIVALLEERRVCIVGPDTALVSRTVLAFANLIRPFEWPHPMSPILLQDMMPVLTAPLPFFVGLLDDHYPDAHALDLDDVVFAHMTSGKVTAVGEVGDLYRRVPRKMRLKIERRLQRAKTACMRQLYRSKSLQSIPDVSQSHAAVSAFLGEELAGPEKGRSLLWKSRSQQKLYPDSSSRKNVWLDHSTVMALDKAMCKFFADLLEDLPSVRAGGADGMGAVVDNATKGVAGIGSSRRDVGRQLVKAFSDTQMFMQWEEGEECDYRFGLGPKEARKRTVLREAEGDGGWWGKGRTQVTSEVEEEVFSGEECVMSGVEDSGGMGRRRKRFGAKWKTKKVRLQFNCEVEEIVVAREEWSDGGEEGGRDGGMSSDVVGGESEMEREEVEREEVGQVGRRSWLNLRLPASGWMFSSSVKETSAAASEVEDPMEGEEEEEEVVVVGRRISEDGFELERVDVEEKGVEEAEGPVSYDGSGRGRVRGWGRMRLRAMGTVKA